MGPDERSVFDAIPVPATLVDAAGIVVGVNQAFLDYAAAHGRVIDPQTRLGRHVAEFAALEAARVRFRAFVDGLLAEGGERELMETSTNAAGRPMHVRVRARCVVGTGGIEGAIILREEVTDEVVSRQRGELVQQLREEVWRMRHVDDVERVLIAVRRGLQRLGLPFDDCGVNVVEPETSAVRSHNMRADGEWRESAATSGVIYGLWRQGEIAYRRDLGREDVHGEGPVLSQRAGHPIAAVIDVPFSRGTLALNSRLPEAFTERDLEILQEVAAVLSEGFDRLADLEALRQSEARYRAVVRQSAEAIFLCDLQTLRLVETNPACDRLFGYAAGELAGCHLSDIAAHDLASLEANARRIEQAGEVFVGERKYRRRDGSLVDVELRVSRVDIGGRAVGCAVARDVTERKRVELRRAALQRLREEVWRMHTGQEIGRLLEVARRSLRDMGVDFEHFGINLVDPDPARPVRVYTDIHRRLQRPREEVESQLIADWWRAGRPVYRPDLEADDPFAERQVIQGSYDQPIRSVLDVPFSHGMVAVNSLRPDAFDAADVACVEELAEALSTGFRRTDDLRRLAQQRQYLEVTLRSIGDGVIATDARGHVQLLNGAAEKLTGWTQAEALGRPLREVFVVVDESTRALRESPVDTVMRDGRVAALAEHGLLLAHDGSERLLAHSGAPIRDATAQVVGVVVVFQDVTAQRRAEAQRERTDRLESLGVLAGGIAHDFNNILTGIIGNLSLAQAELGGAHPRVGSLLSAAETAAQRAARLTGQLLTFARGGAPVRRSTELAEVVREAAEFVLRGSNVRARFEVEAGLWAAHVDPDQVGQVVQNLVLNADQAMPAGGAVVVRLANVRVDEGAGLPVGAGRYVRLEVEDGGQGMDEAVRAHLFEPYFTTKESGSGLGLATVYAIVRKHEGAIEVRSTPGAGSTFSVYLPASSAPAAPAAAAPGAAAAGRGQRVLVMDDEEMIVDLLRLVLTQLGYRVTTTREGGQAVAACREALEAGDPYDVVILDLTVPGGMGGAQAREELHRLAPSLPAIVSSGYSNDPARADHLRHGFQGSMPKPYRFADVARVVAEVLAAARSPQSA